MRQVDQAQRLVCVGDSHCLPLRDVVFYPDDQDTPVVIEAVYIPGLSAPDMVGANGAIGPKLADALDRVGLLGADERGKWASDEPADLNILFASGIPAAPPVLVVFCGDIDLRGAVFRQFNVSFDFDAPGDPVSPRDGLTVVPRGDVESLLVGKFAPIISGIRALWAAGFARTYLAMIPPPSLEDETAFEAAHGFACPLPLRRRLTALANVVLARLCADAGVPFIDVSETVSAGGLLKGEYRLDGFHMTTAGGMRLIADVLEHAVHHSAAHYNAALYARAAAHAVPVDRANPPAFAETKEEFAREGIVRRSIDVAGIDAALSGREFTEDVGNRHLRLTWCGNGREPFNPMMRSLEPDAALLAAVYDAVYSDAARPLFQACVGSDMHFINTRFFLSLPHGDAPVGPQTFHHDGCPPGVIRALIYLVDVDSENGPFEYVDSAGTNHFATGPKGSLLVFDANRLLHRGSPPRGRLRRVIDFCVAPLPAGMPRRVMWAGMNNWPMDPYQVQVEKMLAHPPLTAKWVRHYPFAVAAAAS